MMIEGLNLLKPQNSYAFEVMLVCGTPKIVLDNVQEYKNFVVFRLFKQPKTCFIKVF